MGGGATPGEVPFLPDSPGWAIALLAVILIVTYVLVTLAFRIPRADPPVPAEPTEPGEEGLPYEDEETVDAPPFPDDGERADEPGEAPLSPYWPDPPDSSGPALEALQVNGVRLAIGDTASHCMRAFRPGEGEARPMIQRDGAGGAGEVTRVYRVGRSLLTLTFARDSGTEPLRLTRMEMS